MFFEISNRIDELSKVALEKAKPVFEGIDQKFAIFAAGELDDDALGFAPVTGGTAKIDAFTGSDFAHFARPVDFTGEQFFKMQCFLAGGVCPHDNNFFHNYYS